MTDLDKLREFCHVERCAADRKVKYIKKNVSSMDMEQSHIRAMNQGVISICDKVIRKIKQIEKDERQINNT